MKEMKDDDLREALRRSEEKRTATEVPADFFDKVMGEIETEPKTIKMWRWVAAAACIALVAGIGSAVLFSGKTAQELEMIAETPAEEKIEIQEPAVVINDTAAEPAAAPEPKLEAPQPKVKPNTKPAVQPNPNPNLRMERPLYAANEPATVTADSASTSNADSQDGAGNNFAENSSKSNETYLDPALMDEFIFKMAEFQGVSRIKSECSISNDTNFVEDFYVFPVKQDYDVLGLFVLMASKYSNTTPGYIFNNSEQQIFFSIDDEQNGLNYLWIAERIGDSKIMIYSVHAPIDIEYKSDCYQQFYNDLTFANFNTYY
ncbi:MAG: hypothetical protein IKW77_09360 [Salinivirgaceae bacterium]|nr:hypothetical protein [Salinivirgaceae bacterium]